MSKTKQERKVKLNFDDVVKKTKVCPDHGDCGFFLNEKKCSLCGKELVILRTLWIKYGFLSEYHRKDSGKNKNNPHIDWKITTDMIPVEILDKIIDKIIFGKSSATLKLEFLEDKEHAKIK